MLKLDRSVRASEAHSVAGDGPGESEVAGGGKEQLKELYRELIEIDPMRKGYYNDALVGNAAVLVQPGR